MIKIKHCVMEQANVYAQDNEILMDSYKTVAMLPYYDHDLYSVFDLLFSHNTNIIANNNKLLKLSSCYGDIESMKRFLLCGADISVVKIDKVSPSVKNFIRKDAKKYCSKK